MIIKLRRKQKLCAKSSCLSATDKTLGCNMMEPGKKLGCNMRELGKKLGCNVRGMLAAAGQQHEGNGPGNPSAPLICINLQQATLTCGDEERLEGWGGGRA